MQRARHQRSSQSRSSGGGGSPDTSSTGRPNDFCYLELFISKDAQTRRSAQTSHSLERFAGATLPSQPCKNILSLHFTFNRKCSLPSHREVLGTGGDEEARKNPNRQEIKAFYSASLSYSNFASSSVKVRSSLFRRASEYVPGFHGNRQEAPAWGMKER